MANNALNPLFQETISLLDFAMLGIRVRKHLGGKSNAEHTYSERLDAGMVSRQNSTFMSKGAVNGSAITV